MAEIRIEQTRNRRGVWLVLVLVLVLAALVVWFFASGRAGPTTAADLPGPSPAGAHVAAHPVAA